ncbi:hypothetical protein HELRODRAFT_193452 [Helobdella robusta]|uniref:Uncharacterized protein n=1 Tax=Helobdella robusta TaxID=6412 RepID=T1FV01_HELRO|nr:hypothetical protein HELRODRAFT_193452 [Helobdella robusta]ESN95954.1 hypothetical protein HELRODRAFT_193452 [Helobdella robusta]
MATSGIIKTVAKHIPLIKFPNRLAAAAMAATQQSKQPSSSASAKTARGSGLPESTLSMRFRRRPLDQVEIDYVLRIPRRFKKAFYSEMISANPDTAHPLAPDFSFHLTYDKNKVKIFHDTNCSCIYRIYMLPPFSSYLNKVDLLKPQDLKNLFLEITLDDVTTIYSLTEILEGEKGPFLSPVSSKNSKPLSGIGSYTPFCYAKSASIHYVDDNEYPTNLLNLTVSCVANELKCPIKQYTTVSYMKSSCLPDEQSTFSQLNKENFANLDYLVEYFKYPENYGPHDDDGCNLVAKISVGKTKS